MKNISQKVANISPSMTVRIDTKAKELKSQGKDIISLCAGEPDFDTPDYIKEYAIKSIKDGLTKYTAPSGILEVKQSICQKLKNENQIDYLPEQIIISSGAKHCISNTFTALLDSNDEVIIPAPYWVTYPELTKLNDAKPVIVETEPQNNFKITAQQLEQAITDKTKLFILNSPTNPTGSVYNQDELEALAKVIVKHDIYCLCDEIYEHIIYDQAKHISIASLNEEIYKRTITINGMSKAYAMTGWRLGYTAASKEIAKAIAKIQSQTTHHPANASQYAAKVALEGGLDSVENMRLEFVKRRDYTLKELRKIPDLTVATPQGAFYVFPNISSYLGKSFQGKIMGTPVDLCQYLLEEQLLAIVPGDAFGNKSCVRLSYATDLNNIKAALIRFKNGLQALK